MKIFCSYALTGEDEATVNKRMGVVVETLKTLGHDAYCSQFDPKKAELQKADDTKGIFEYAFSQVKNVDAMVAIVSSTNRSVGQLLEVGCLLSQGKPLYLFEHGSAQGTSYLPKLADKYYVWSDEDDLQRKLKEAL